MLTVPAWTNQPVLGRWFLVPVMCRYYFQNYNTLKASLVRAGGVRWYHLVFLPMDQNRSTNQHGTVVRYHTKVQYHEVPGRYQVVPR